MAATGRAGAREREQRAYLAAGGLPYGLAAAHEKGGIGGELLS